MMSVLRPLNRYIPAARLRYRCISSAPSAVHLSSRDNYFGTVHLGSGSIVSAGDGNISSYTYPGSRVIELSNLSNGNLLTLETLTAVSSRLKTYAKNNIVSAVMFSSKVDPSREDDNVFSVGVDYTTSQSSDVLIAAQTLAREINEHKTITLSSFEGHTSGWAYGVFGGAKYRLGTADTVLCVDELSKGVLPLGGFAHHCSRANKDGVAFARYLALSQRSLECEELFSLGLISHIVSPECHTTLLLALGHSLSAE
jgi:enoyl-CoA hydratase/carnithine racemase